MMSRHALRSAVGNELLFHFHFIIWFTADLEVRSGNKLFIVDRWILIDMHAQRWEAMDYMDSKM